MNMLRVLGMVKAIGQSNFIETDLKEFEMCFIYGTVKYIFGAHLKCAE